MPLLVLLLLAVALGMLATNLLLVADLWARVRHPPGMVRVPPGPDGAPAFYLDPTEVTYEQYKAFVAASGYQPKGEWGRYFPYGGDPAPVVGVTWADADAYARHYGKRLPSGGEWLRAVGGRAWPWGDAWEEGAANVNTGKVAPVASYPRDRSPYGVFDLCGNVFEWTSSPSRVEPKSVAVLGSCWLYVPQPINEAIAHNPTTNSGSVGFRCAWP